MSPRCSKGTWRNARTLTLATSVTITPVRAGYNRRNQGIARSKIPKRRLFPAAAKAPLCAADSECATNPPFVEAYDNMVGSAPFSPQTFRYTRDFTQITQNVSSANSIYNSLQMSVDRRFSRGFTLGAPHRPGRHQRDQPEAYRASIEISHIGSSTRRCGARGGCGTRAERCKA